MFTELEKKILDATESKYKYITRDRIGRLFLSTNKPSFHGEYLYSGGESTALNAFISMFEDVKIGGEPIRFRSPILDDIEREYLKAVFKPFHQNVRCVRKMKQIEEGLEYIKAVTNGDSMFFPSFKAGKMYTGMEPYKEYSLEELGIVYD